jgi:hypothetical protein
LLSPLLAGNVCARSGLALLLLRRLRNIINDLLARHAVNHYARILGELVLRYLLNRGSGCFIKARKVFG